jgi:glycosyltransferase involved in cell wall biosynthesis
MPPGIQLLMIGPYPHEAGKVVGGIEAVVSALAPALAAQEQIARVTVLSFHHGETATRTERVSDKLDVRFLPGQRRLRLLSRSFMDVLQARRVIAELGVNVVHGHGIGRSGDTAIQLLPASVITVHGLVHREAQLAEGSLKARVRSRFVASAVRRVLRDARVVISISDYDARALEGLVRGRRVSIANPIAAPFFADAPPSDASHVLFAGVLGRRKNMEGLLNGFALVRRRVPGARLLVLGPAPDRQYAGEIRALVRRLGLDDAVEFAGHVENERLVRELHACGMVVLFSHEETAPTILAQAMAAGKPVVASRVGGIPEMVADGQSGFLVNPGDERALAERLVELIESPELRRRFGENGRVLARQRYEAAAVARQTVEAYQLALSPVHTLGALAQRQGFSVLNSSGKEGGCGGVPLTSSPPNTVKCHETLSKE